MTREDHVLELFVEANPVPDLTGVVVEPITVHLDAVEQRSAHMEPTELRKIEAAADQRRRGWLVGGAAAALVLVIGIGLATAVFMNRPDDTATEPTDPAVAAVLTALDAYNAGDVDGWRAAFEPGAEDVGRTGGHSFFEILMNANEQMTVVEPCQVVQSDPTIVECTIAYRDDFYGRAGIGVTALTQFRLNDQLLITDWQSGERNSAERGEFNRAFHQWLASAHPDVYADIQPVDNGSLPGYGSGLGPTGELLLDPANMTTAIQYVDEFIAQSDVYPIDPTSP